MGTEITSVGVGWVSESDGTHRSDPLLEKTARESYAAGYRSARSKLRDPWEWFSGFFLASALWLLIWIFARAL